MGSIGDGAMAVMGILAGLMLALTSLKISESITQSCEVKAEAKNSLRSKNKVA